MIAEPVQIHNRSSEIMEVCDENYKSGEPVPPLQAAAIGEGNTSGNNGMIVPEQIVVPNTGKNTNEHQPMSSNAEEALQEKHHRRQHRRDKVKSKGKEAHKSSSGRHKKRHRHSKSEDGTERKHRDEKRRRRRHRRDRRDDDPETIKKRQELLLTSMGVPLPPDTEPSFMPQKNNFDDNPVYQCNKKRLSSNHNNPTSLNESASDPHISGATTTSSTTDTSTSCLMETSKSAEELLGAGGGLRKSKSDDAMEANSTNGDNQPATIAGGAGMGSRRGSVMYGQYIEF